MMETAVTVFLGLLKAPFLALQNSLAERTLDTGSVLDELINRQIIGF